MVNIPTLLHIAQWLLGGFGIEGLADKALAYLAKIKPDVPDLAGQISAVEQFLVNELKPQLDVEKIRTTLRGIAVDIVAGSAGKDRDAWGISV